MSASRQNDWTIESFLAWEERQELRYEFDGFQPLAMTGGTYAHDAIQVNLIAALHARLVGKPCRVHGSSLKIRVMGSIRYPDAFVTCAPIALGTTLVDEPVVIFEVLSKSTARTDRTAKNREYAATGSVRRYIMLEQTAPEGTMFTREGENGDWIGRLVPPGATIDLPEIGIQLPLAEIYAGMEFAAELSDEAL